VNSASKHAEVTFSGLFAYGILVAQVTPKINAIRNAAAVDDRLCPGCLANLCSRDPYQQTHDQRPGHGDREEPCSGFLPMGREQVRSHDPLSRQ